MEEAVYLFIESSLEFHLVAGWRCLLCSQNYSLCCLSKIFELRELSTSTFKHSYSFLSISFAVDKTPSGIIMRRIFWLSPSFPICVGLNRKQDLGAYGECGPCWWLLGPVLSLGKSGEVGSSWNGVSF